MDIIDQILSNLKNSTDVPFTFEANITGLGDFLKTVSSDLKTSINSVTYNFVFNFDQR